MPLATQTHREVSVKTVLGDDVLLFKHMHCVEELGRPYQFDLKLASSRSDIKIADVLGTDLTVSLDLGSGTRYYHGIVTRFSYRGWRDGMASYEAVVQPALWLLTRSSDCRIFQDMSALDIVKQVCGATVYGGLIAIDQGALSGTPAVRTYCVQYRETDFDFVCRLLEEEGIYFYFKHADGAHTMVLADGYGAHAPISGEASVSFHEEDCGRAAREDSITRFMPSGQIQASTCSLNDFNFEVAGSSLSGSLRAKKTIAAAFVDGGYEQYDYPGRYRTSAVGEAFARARVEALHGQGERIEASTNARALATGSLFTLAGHPREDQNRQYLVTSAVTDIAGSDYSSGGSAHGTDFRCEFTAVGKEHSFRPPPVARKPYVHGPQTAMVVGKAGEEIWTDKYGRVKVQFHWDRLGKEDENSSCFVRVAQGWAGKSWGTMFIPRIGMEVVVSFLEGDPDQPLITGCVYNSDAMPPYALPGEQTKSTIKSNTSKGGNGFNEIRFEDRKDAEEIFIQAEKDFNRVVKNNDTLKVGFEKADKGDQTIGIKNDQSLEVGNDRTIVVKHDQKVDIDNDLTTTVKNNEKHTVQKDQSITVQGAQDVSVTKTIVIEAGTSIELKVGASSIKIEAGKITIKSPEVAVQADGMGAIKAGGVLTVEGALVKIN